MRGFKQLSKIFLAGGVLAASLSSCGDYRIYDVHVTSSAGSNASSREFITLCEMTISIDGEPKPILDRFALSGCQGGTLTTPEVGRFSYSTSRTSGTLKFQVDALDHVNTTIQSGNSSAVDSASYPWKVEVNMVPK
jgi:hypothetical protein